MKIKSIFLIPILLFGVLIKAQIPNGYYDAAAGLTGSALKTALSQIISQGHNDRGYAGLYTAYNTTDIDQFYEKDGTVLDMYSENPTGADPYNFTPGVKQCGNYSTEGDCYNREHVVPQSFFSSNAPMVSDVHFIRPTDGKVNGMRSNYPFGKVGTTSFTSKNGSKLGSCVSAGYSGTVFEPIDEFKGDIARMIFYFVTRYESRLSGFSTGNMLGGSAFPGLQTWELNVLLAWSAQDPVSEAETKRNDASYTWQGNRNPFIDHPEYVNTIWGNVTADTEAPTTPTNLTTGTATSSSISLSWTSSTDNVAVIGYDIYVNGVFKTSVTGNSATVGGLSSSTTYSFYVIAKDAAGNFSSASNTATGTTLAGDSSSTCANETFETIPANATSYAARTWTNNGITWTATDARTDQTLNQRAITLRNSILTSSTSPNGIGNLTVTTQQKFSGNAGTFTVKVNGNPVGTIPFTVSSTSAPGSITTTTIPNINITGDVVITIDTNSNGANSRVAIDDLSWTCYSTLSSTEQKVNKAFAVFPNPVKNHQLFVKGVQLEKVAKAEIYNQNGQLVQTINNPFSKANYINLSNSLSKGLYIVKFNNHSEKFIVE